MPIHGNRGKQRSVHNTYFTLPVLFAMLSNHYSFTYAHPQNWLILIGMMFAGRRHPPVLRHAPRVQAGPQPAPLEVRGRRRGGAAGADGLAAACSLGARRGGTSHRGLRPDCSRWWRSAA